MNTVPATSSQDMNLAQDYYCTAVPGEMRTPEFILSTFLPMTAYSSAFSAAREAMPMTWELSP